jgi:hypothetical protein
MSAPDASLLQVLSVFAPTFVRALGTNLSLALEALAIGLPAGLALGALRLPETHGEPSTWRRLSASGAGTVVALLRAAPAFVVMHVLLHALPARWAMSPGGAVAWSLSAYAAAYVADNLRVAVLDWRAGARGGVPLFLMGLARAYFVMVLSSGFGAAVGVKEATAVTLRALEQLPQAADRLCLIGGVVLVFVALRQAVDAAILAAQRAVERRSG